MNEITLSADAVCTIVFAIFVLMFWAVHWLLKEAIQSRYDAATVKKQLTFEKQEACYRAVSADIIRRFVWLLLNVSACLALALGIMKVFTNVVRFILPEQYLGLVILISYCGLIAAVQVIAPNFVKKLIRHLYPVKSS